MIDGSPIRRALVIFAAVAIVGAAGLVAAGAVGQRGTAFSLQVPNSGPVAVLGRSQRACQGPLMASVAFRGVQLWLAPASAPGARFVVSATGPDGTVLSSGIVMVGAHAQPTARVWLDRTIPAGTRLSLCFENSGPGALSLTGGPANRDSGVLERNGHELGLAAAAVVLSPRPRSMLELLPSAFNRAALFRPTWMGAWTYWTLLAAIIAAIPLVAFALRLAAREDAEP